MRAYLAFVNKEWTEGFRTYKLVSLLIAFLLFGMMNPLIAKLTPELMTSLSPEGIVMQIAEPQALDSWTQFFKNMAIQLILFVIVFSGLMANELTKGTLINILTKGLPRKTVILSKFTSTSIIWSLCYLLCFVVTYGYTIYLLPGSLPNLLFSAFCLWLFGIWLISVMILGGVMFKSMYGSLLFTGAIALFLMVANILPGFQTFNPYGLSALNLALLTKEMSPSDFTVSIIVTSVTTVVFLAGSMAIFNKKQV